MRNVVPLRFVSSSLTWSVCILATCSGCASLHLPRASSLPVVQGQQGPLSKQDAQAAMQRIDQVRDQAQCAQAVTLWQEGRTAEGRRLLDQVLARNPQQPEARRLLADLALERGDVTEAEQLLVNVIKDHPDDQASRASLAWLYESQGRSQEAQALFQLLEEGFSPER